MVQSDAYNQSRLATVVVAVITSNTALASLPGNTFLPAGAVGLPRDSVVNATALATVNKADLSTRAGAVAGELMLQVDSGLRRVVGLSRDADRGRAP